MKRTLAAVAAAAGLILTTGVPSQAALPVYIKNHILSVANLSITDTNPARSGHIYILKPGKAGTGLGVYASAAKATWCYLGSSYSNGHYLKAGAWNYLAYSNSQYTCQVFNP